jgi:transcriptional regulator with XRE-family HTH domain
MSSYLTGHVLDFTLPATCLSRKSGKLGWTRKSAGVSVLLAMEEHRRQAGARVLQLREAKRWTHEDLAHAAGLSVKTVSRFEKGRNEGRRTTIRKLAQALNVDEADIIGAPPAPLGLGVVQSDDAGNEAAATLRQLVERQEAVEQALVALTQELATLRRQGPQRRARAS